MSMAAELVLECPSCACARPFEQPPCVDGHGPDCDEWACTACGTALLVDPLLYAEAPVAASEVRAA